MGRFEFYLGSYFCLLDSFLVSGIVQEDFDS